MGVTKRIIVDDFEDIEDYPVGTIVRAEAWGDVAVKRCESKYLGKSIPTARQILDGGELFEERVFWTFIGMGTPFISCDGPFTVIYNPEEER